MLINSIFAKVKKTALVLSLLSAFFVMVPAVAYAAPQACGSGDTKYTPSIELGCEGKGNAIMDLLFALVKFLSFGIGLVIVGSMTYAGIQYIGSRGDPSAHAQAIKRIQSNVTALLLFIFAYAFLNYIIPGAILK